MNRFARALLTLSLLLSGNLYAAISGTARSSPQYDNCGTGDWGGASCQVNISGTTGFAANDLIVAVWSRNDDTTDLAPVLPSEGGWTQGPWYGASTAGKIACSVAWKKASGSETTVTPSWSYTGTAQGGKVMAMVIPGTDLNLNALGDSSENEANVASATTSLSSGSASNSTATGLAIAAFCSDNDTDQTGPPTYTNSFTAQATSLTGAYAKTWAATKVLSSAAAQTTTATIVSDEGYGSILVFNASGSTCPATCAGGRSARCITDISDASDPDNLLYGLSPAAVANEDTVCYDATSVLGDTVNVTAAGWPSIASSGSQLTDSFDYCVMDNGAACGTDGKYEVTFQPTITSVTGIGTGQTTGTVTVTPAGPTEGTVRGVAILKSVYDLYGPPDHDQIAAGVDANYDGVSWGSEFTSDLATPDVWTNLLTYSEQFDDGAWTKPATSISLNATTAPDGSNAADKIIESSSTALHLMYSVNVTKAASAITYTGSIYLKAAEKQYAQIRITRNNGATYGTCVFDLSTGTAGTITESGFTGTSATITDVGSGWYRATITSTSDTDTGVRLQVYLTNSGGSPISYTGDGTSGIYLWGAQLREGSTAGPYTPTTAAARARFDGYTFSRASSQTYEKSDGTLGTVTSGNPAFQYSGGTAHGVLLEGARTNIVTQNSVGITSATGLTKAGDAAATLTVVDDTSEITSAGLLSLVGANVYKLDNSAGSGSASVVVPGNPSSTAAHAYSVYARVTGSNAYLSDATGSATTTFTNAAYARVTNLRDPATSGSSGALTIKALAGSTVWFALMQLEVGSFASSVIPITASAAVPRNATSLTRSWNFPSNNVSGQIKVRPQFAYNDSKGAYYNIVIAEYNTDNYFRIAVNPTNDVIYATRRVAGTSAEAATSSGELNYANGELLNIRFRADTTGVYLWVDDSNSSTVDSCTSADCKTSFSNRPTEIRFLSAAGSASTLLPGVVESLTIYNEAKSDAFLEALE